MNLASHAVFIIAAYGAALAVVAALVAWVVADHRAQRRMLAEFDARGVSRRALSQDAS